MPLRCIHFSTDFSGRQFQTGKSGEQCDDNEKIICDGFDGARGGCVFVMPAQAEEGKIEAGIFVNDIDLSGLTQDEAAKEIEAYVAGFGDAQITLHAPEEGEIIVSAADLGLQWGNREILDEAVNLAGMAMFCNATKN